jgi:hypothetical protein
MVEIDQETIRAIRHHAKLRSNRQIAAFMERLLDADLMQILVDYRLGELRKRAPRQPRCSRG